MLSPFLLFEIPVLAVGFIKTLEAPARERRVLKVVI